MDFFQKKFQLFQAKILSCGSQKYLVDYCRSDLLTKTLPMIKFDMIFDPRPPPHTHTKMYFMDGPRTRSYETLGYILKASNKRRKKKI